MKKIFALTALAAGLCATPAMAQSSAPGGLYLGALGGYEGIDVESADGSVSASADSAVYGVNAGYDLSLGSAFVGVEGELSTSGGDTQFPSSFTGARDSLDANGQYYLNRNAIPNNTLQDKLTNIYTARTEDKILYVKADKNLDYGKVLDALDIASKAGVRM